MAKEQHGLEFSYNVMIHGVEEAMKFIALDGAKKVIAGAPDGLVDRRLEVLKGVRQVLIRLKETPK
jgi:hypothetical protein